MKASSSLPSKYAAARKLSIDFARSKPEAQQRHGRGAVRSTRRRREERERARERERDSESKREYRERESTELLNLLVTTLSLPFPYLVSLFRFVFPSSLYFGKFQQL